MSIHEDSSSGVVQNKSMLGQTLDDADEISVKVIREASKNYLIQYKFENLTEARESLDMYKCEHCNDCIFCSYKWTLY